MTRLPVLSSQVCSLQLDLNLLICPADSEKSTTQKAGDTARGNADSAQNEGASYLDSAKKTVSDAAGSAQETLQNAGKFC